MAVAVKNSVPLDPQYAVKNSVPLDPFRSQMYEGIIEVLNGLFATR
jgi:hypothetical protein